LQHVTYITLTSGTATGGMQYYRYCWSRGRNEEEKEAQFPGCRITAAGAE